jgi:peptide/nickel transport system permease protein
MAETAADRPPAPAMSASAGRRGRALWLLGVALRTPRGMIGAALALVVVAIGLFGPFVSASSLAFTATPFAPAGGSNGLLGADVLGRSVLARSLSGGSQLLLMAIAATALAVLLGALIGVTAAYHGRWIDAILMRSADVVLAIPQLVFVLVVLSMVGPQWWIIVLAVAVAQAPQVARVLRSAAQDVCERDYVKAVAVWGVSPRTVIRRHVLPSLLTPLMVEAGLRLSFSIVIIAGLNYLGLGTQPPFPNWGVMISENQVGLASNPWGVLAPAILLGVLAVGTNMFSDAIARVSVGDRVSRQIVLEARAPEFPLDEGPLDARAAQILPLDGPQ